MRLRKIPRRIAVKARNILRRIRRSENIHQKIRLAKYSGSPTYYKDGINPAAYGFEERQCWEYRDKRRVENPYDFILNEPHLVLFDSAGTPRFTLWYTEKDNRITINSIQCERTAQAYVMGQKGYTYSPELEAKATHEFAAQLGVHPAEFLVSEVIYKNRGNIRQGKQIYLAQWGTRYSKTYKPIRDRFFTKRPSGGIVSKAYPLNTGKRRVRQILQL